jgi:hypothetical protein
LLDDFLNPISVTVTTSQNGGRTATLGLHIRCSVLHK